MEKRYDVFVSCKSEDYTKAEPVFHWLVEKGHNPFFAPISLRVSKIQGEPIVFGDEIDDALEQADNMVLYASKAEYVSKGYVKDEWRTFVEEQRAGRKSGSLVTILDGVNVADLPIRLRSVQSFTPSNYKTGILRFLGDVIETDSQDKKQIFMVNGFPFDMIKVEGGTFQMGSNNSEAYDNEKPVHSVTVSSFYIGETVVTRALWQAVINGFLKDDNLDGLPVVNVSYDDIVNEFIPKLNRLTSKNFRLPTEAEWEFAARGGNKGKRYKYAGNDSIGSVAWYKDNSGDDIHPVKSKLPNELGLYDMNGNVWEWCSDLYGNYSSGSQTNPAGPIGGDDFRMRVLRGGSYANRAWTCRVSSRIGCSSYANDFPAGEGCTGFRLALSW